MIDPKLLTPENGFVEGCVVELEMFGGRRIGFWPDIRKGIPVHASIRPLTGPMAIWNFAPEWALSLIRTPDQDIVWSRRIAADQPQEHTAQDRPWWAN